MRPIAGIECDMAVVGAGSAGLAAAVAAARNGARTLLIDGGPSVGGELLSGLPLNACLSTRGEWVVGGIVRELLDRCDAMGELVPPYFDWRALWLVCVDPEIMKLACVMLAHEAGVKLLLNTFAEQPVVEDGAITGLVVANRSGRTLVRAAQYIDCSGDGDLCVSAGAPWEKGGEGGAFQPVTMMFRMQGVGTAPLLDFVVDHPDWVGLAESPATEPLGRAECARRQRDQGVPSVFFDCRRPFLAEAIARGELAPCGILAVCPVSPARKEVSLNTTRIADLDATYPVR